MTKKPEREIEFEPDAWERFERAVKIVAKSPPHHRAKQKPVSGVAKKRISDSSVAKKKSGRRPSKIGS
jgi:hypothetical protein